MWQKILRSDLAKISALFLVWRLTLFGVGFIALAIMPKIVAGELSFVSFNFWQVWANWDGGHFLGIAENGYKFTQQYAFFPLFPILISLVARIFLGNFLVAGLVVANLLALSASIILFKLVSLDFNKDFSFRTLMYFLFFPTVFFLGAVYSEAVFLAVTLLAFYAVRKKNFYLASLSAALAVLTKPYGILIVVPLLIEYLNQRKKGLGFSFGPGFSLILLPVSTFLLYLIYLHNVAGDAFIFVKVQKEWLRVVANPIATFWDYYVGLLTPNVNLFYGIKLLELSSVILVLATVFVGSNLLRASYFVYLVLFFIVFVSSGTFTSFPRFVLILWPVFLVLSNLGKNALFDFFYKLVSISLLGLLLGLFLSGFFIS